MREENPLVSIIVRTKDRPRLLARALQSIAAQTYRPIEAVVVNDGGCRLDPVRLGGLLGDVGLAYVPLAENQGRAHAANVGVENARGAYVGFLDDDDELYPDHVAVLADSMAAHTGISPWARSSPGPKAHGRKRGELGKQQRGGSGG